MRVWKRNLVVVAIVVFVGVAVYLNWSYNNNQTATDANATESGDPAKVLGETELVSGTEEGDSADTVTEETGYFATARLNRQQARDSALELLQQAAAEDGADQAAINEANAAIQTMAAYTMSEAQMENLVIAKGYGDCVCFLNDGSVSVVVSATEEGLSDNDIAKIVEIVMDETGLTADQITIIEAAP